MSSCDPQANPHHGPRAVTRAEKVSRLAVHQADINGFVPALARDRDGSHHWPGSSPDSESTIRDSLD